MSRSTLQPPRGSRDFYPEDYRLREWLFDHFRSVARRFAFEEVDAPILEHAELFIRKAGEEIVDQLYHFTLHDRHLALRGELTPSLARMVIARAGALRFPLRWFAIGQNWRYERMTRGRKREHYQWNMEILGEADVTAEAELVAAMFALLDELGLPEDAVRMRINSRAWIEETLRQGPLDKRPDAFAPLCVIIDKLRKVGAQGVTEQLTDPKGPVALRADEAKRVLEVLAVGDLDEAARFVGADSPALGELRRLFELLEGYGLSSRVVFDASVVRGLAYYTGIVFECFDSAGELRSLCGGGRYDQLLETLGGPPTPAVGFGFGDVVIGELLADRHLLPKLTRPLDDVVYAFGEAERPAAARLATRLRQKGRRVEFVLSSAKLKRVLSDADKGGADRIWLLGPDELQRGVAKVRDLASGAERDEKLDG